MLFHYTTEAACLKPHTKLFAHHMRLLEHLSMLCPTWTLKIGQV